MIQVDYEVYVITAPGFWYVGSTTTGAHKRFRRHMAGKGRAPLLSRKVQELGGGAFSLAILEEATGSPVEAEQRWYDYYLVQDPRQSLNAQRPGGFFGGQTHTPEARKRMSLAKKGKPAHPQTIVTRAKISASKKGVPSPLKGKPGKKGGRNSSESNAKRSATLKGHPNWGPKKHTDETRAKLSAALIGNTRCVGRIPWNKGIRHRPAQALTSPPKK